MQGVNDLEEGGKLNGLRAIICNLALLIYHLVVSQVIGNVPDFETCNRILDTYTQVNEFFPVNVYIKIFVNSKLHLSI